MTQELTSSCLNIDTELSLPHVSLSVSFSLKETYIEIQTEHLPQLLLRMVSALTTHLQALGLKELTHCLRLCSKILSKVQPPLVSPLALPPAATTPSARDKDEKMVRADNQMIQTCLVNKNPKPHV